MVDYEAMDVFYKVEEYNVNHILDILVETLIPLQVYHESQQGNCNDVHK